MTWESHEFFRDGAGWMVSHHQGRPARLMKSWWPVSARCCRRYFSAPGLILHAAALEIHGQTLSKGIEQSFISFIIHHYYYYYFIIISNYFIYVYMHAFIKIYLIPSLYIMIYLIFLKREMLSTKFKDSPANAHSFWMPPGDVRDGQNRLKRFFCRQVAVATQRINLDPSKNEEKTPGRRLGTPKKGPTLHGPTWGTCNNVRVPSMFFRQHLRISAGAPAFLDQANDRKIWVCLKVGCP